VRRAQRRFLSIHKEGSMHPSSVTSTDQAIVATPEKSMTVLSEIRHQIERTVIAGRTVTENFTADSVAREGGSDGGSGDMA
jgi:hypothetical protein